MPLNAQPCSMTLSGSHSAFFAIAAWVLDEAEDRFRPV
jgi:hypothetical protein